MAVPHEQSFEFCFFTCPRVLIDMMLCVYLIIRLIVYPVRYVIMCRVLIEAYQINSRGQIFPPNFLSTTSTAGTLRTKIPFKYFLSRNYDFSFGCTLERINTLFRPRLSYVSLA